MKKIILLAITALSCLTMSAQKWTPLCDGKDLDGWHQVTGEAKYSVKDGCIVGVCTRSQINSFLATDASYSDFILEFSFKVEDPLNSGVQFRSRVNEKGYTTGYQYEFDPSDRAWTAGIYDEAARGWLYPLTFNVEAGKAFKHNDWNEGRIEAVGTHIRTFLNGVLCSDL